MKNSILSPFLSFAVALSFFGLVVSDSGHTKTAPVPQHGTASVKLLNASGLQTIIHRRNGKILILNIWATWCLPCMEEFPDLIKAVSAYDTNKVEVVGISLDYADEIQTKVLPFIRKNNIPFRMYLAQFHSQEQFINSVQKTWNGAIPATFIYDRNGRQKRSLIGEQTFDQFKATIDTVLQAN
jgi:thiol-disulfide isomerase/thioredoxin